MGFFGDLVGGFTGKSARKDIDKGIGAVNENTGKATGAITAGADEAKGYLDPYRQQGGRAFGMYGDTLGVNGLDARARAQDIYTSDPILAQMRDLDAKKQGWAFNARGGYGSGAHALASNRAMLENYGNWQGQLNQLGQQGQAAAGATANIAQQAGRDVAGAYGQNSAALAGLYGERAKTQNTLAQNMLGLGGLAVGAATGMPIGFGGNNLGTQAGTAANGGFTTTTTQAPWYQRYNPFG
jgi:hypothetical protein